VTPGLRSALAFGFAAACLCVQACGFGFKVDVGLAQWAVDGDVALGPSGGGSTGLGDRKNDTGDALGFENWRTTPYMRLAADAEKTHLSLATLWFDQNASGVLSHGFGDLPPGEPVGTEAQFLSFKLAMHYDWFERAPITISPGVGVHYLDMDVRASSPAGSERISTALPMPSLYVKTTADLGSLVGELDLGWGGMAFPSVSGTVTDIETMLRWSPAPLVELFAGYRFAFFNLDGETGGKSFTSDYLLHGWLIGFKIGP